MSRLRKIRNLLINELSKSSAARAASPRLRSWYAEYVANDSRKKKFLAGHPERILLGYWHRIAFWRSAPAHFAGGILLNLLGFQILRHYIHNRWRAGRKVHQRFQQLHDHGVMRAPGILTADDLAQVRAFYDRHVSRSNVYLPDFSELIIYSNLLTVGNENFKEIEFQRFRDYLIDRLDLARLYEQMSGKPLVYQPFISIIHHKSFVNRTYTAQQDGNNRPHRDVFYPSYKIFVYLNDVTEDNAAFIYYPGTHDISTCTAGQAYKSSLNYYLVEKRANLPVDALATYEQKPQAVSQTGVAGSAVFFNVAGIHQRGDYKKDKDRERIVLLVDFRQNDAWIVPRSQRWRARVC